MHLCEWSSTRVVFLSGNSQAGPTPECLPVNCVRDVWRDEVGRRHEVQQHEGREQGYPLMPLLFSFAIHTQCTGRSEAGDVGWRGTVRLFLDDVCILSSPARTRFLWNLVGKTWRGFNCTLAKPDVRTGRDCAHRTCKNWISRGVEPKRIGGVGDLVGSDEFVQEVNDSRLEEEHKLWNETPQITDLQCAWHVFLRCVGPRCHHFSEPCLGCSDQWRPSSGVFLETQHRMRLLTRWPRCS